MSNPTTFAQLASDPRVSDVYREPGNGTWVHLRQGYICPEMECGTIHESTVAECCRLMRGVRRENLSLATLQETAERLGWDG